MPITGTTAAVSDPNAVLRSPRQASSTYDVGGAQAPRPKGLFYARFIRGDNSDGIAYWERDHGFLVRSVDSPSISPKVEEVNQYNKKRQIIVGYNMQPISMTLTDTADGMVLRMWNDYSSYYFGDFNQATGSYAYDAISLNGSNMFGYGTGFGFTPQMSSNPDDLYYFKALEIYQVFRNAYTLTTLVNPRIIAFDPDDHDYSSMETHQFKLQISYEAVLYDNQGVPQLIDGSPIADVFADIRLQGDTIDVPGVQGVAAPVTGSRGVSGMVTPPAFSLTPIADPLAATTGGVPNMSGLGGVLGTFGSFNFGGIASPVAGNVIAGNPQNIASSLAVTATTNPQLAAVLGMAQTVAPSATVLGGLASLTSAQTGGISQASYDMALGTVQAAGGSDLASSPFGQQLVSGILASAAVSGSPPMQQVTGQAGMTLTPTALNVVNALRSPASQIGYQSGVVPAMPTETDINGPPTPVPPISPETGGYIPGQIDFSNINSTITGIFIGAI